MIMFLIGCISYGQSQSPMDVYETNMKIEYQRHNIGNITNYILNHKELGKTEFVLDGKLYKMKVIKNTKLSGGYVRGSSSRENDWVEGESLKFFVKQGHREYIYTLRGNIVQLWSDSMSFFAYYNIEKQEVSIRTDRYNFNSSQYKMFAYDYSYTNGDLEKVQDWIVRDADGRANSMGKIYPKK